MEKDGVKKVQTFCSFDKDVTRASVDEVKDKFPDAFVSTLEAPVVSLKYTNKFSAAEEVSKDINTLAKNFEEESKFWNENKNTENLNKETYKNIMSNRKTIIESIETSAKQLDYNEMKEFKEGLLRFTQSVGDKLEISIKGVEESQESIVAIFDTSFSLFSTSLLFSFLLLLSFSVGFFFLFNSSNSFEISLDVISLLDNVSIDLFQNSTLSAI